MMDGRFDQYFLELFATAVDEKITTGDLPSRWAFLRDVGLFPLWGHVTLTRKVGRGSGDAIQPPQSQSTVS
jgi:hypothetical protein